MRSILAVLVLCLLALLVVGLVRSLYQTVNVPRSYVYPGAVQTLAGHTCMSHLTLETGSFKAGARSGKINEVNIPDGVSVGRQFANTYNIDVNGFSAPLADTYSDQLRLLHPDCKGVLPNVHITCQLNGAVTPIFIQQCLNQTGVLPVKPDSCRTTYTHKLFNENSVDGSFIFAPGNRILLYAPHGFSSSVAFERLGYFYLSRDSTFHGQVTVSGNEIQLFQWVGDTSQDVRTTAQNILDCVSTYWTFVYYPDTQW